MRLTRRRVRLLETLRQDVGKACEVVKQSYFRIRNAIAGLRQTASIQLLFYEPGG
jgi:hypothetical protein